MSTENSLVKYKSEVEIKSSYADIIENLNAEILATKAIEVKNEQNYNQATIQVQKLKVTMDAIDNKFKELMLPYETQIKYLKLAYSSLKAEYDNTNKSIKGRMAAFVVQERNRIEEENEKKRKEAEEKAKEAAKLLAKEIKENLVIVYSHTKEGIEKINEHNNPEDARMSEIFAKYIKGFPVIKSINVYCTRCFNLIKHVGTAKAAMYKGTINADKFKEIVKDSLNHLELASNETEKNTSETIEQAAIVQVENDLPPLTKKIGSNVVQQWKVTVLDVNKIPDQFLNKTAKLTELKNYAKEKFKDKEKVGTKIEENGVLFEFEAKQR